MDQGEGVDEGVEVEGVETLPGEITDADFLTLE